MLAVAEPTNGIDVYIRRNADGLVRVHHDDPWEAHSHYQWIDGGNYSCDCNRHLFFQRAADEDDDEDFPCGDTAYTITKIVDCATGCVIAADDPD